MLKMHLSCIKCSQQASDCSKNIFYSWNCFIALRIIISGLHVPQLLNVQAFIWKGQPITRLKGSGVGLFQMEDKLRGSIKYKISVILNHAKLMVESTISFK